MRSKRKTGIYLMCGAVLVFAVSPLRVSAAFTQFLDYGSVGSEVSELQQFLKDKGFFPANQNVTTFFGQITKDAVARFQASLGIDSIGRVGPRTLLALNESDLVPSASVSAAGQQLQIGMSGPDVVRLQQFLKGKGFYLYPELTGYFGPITDAALRAYQTSSGTTSNGIADYNILDLISQPKDASDGDAQPTKKTIKRSGGKPRSDDDDEEVVAANDITAPTVEITDPSDSDTVSESVSIEADADDDVFVSGVQFYVDGSAFGSEDTSSPYSVDWDTMSVSNGTHSLIAVARDSSGNYATSSEVTVTTDNYDIYVDSNSGSDLNDGTTVDAPFQTLAAAVTAAGSQSDIKIGLASDSVWEEQLVLTGNGIEVSAYGTGDMPLIDAGDTIASGSFSLTSGRTYTYEAPVSITGQTGVEQRLVWEDGKFLRQATSTAAVESTPGSFFFASYSATSTTVYVHPTDNSNPASNGKDYDFTKRYYGIAITGTDAVIDGIRTRRQRANDGSVVIYGTNGTMRNGIADDGHKHSAYLGDGGVVDNYVFRNAYNGTAGFPNYLVFHRNSGSGLGMTVTDTEFTTDVSVVPVGTSGLPSSFPSAIISHVSSSGNMGAAVTNGNTMTLTTGYGFANFTGLVSTDDTWINSTTLGYTGDPVDIEFVRPTYTASNPNFTAGVVSPYFYSLNPSSGRLSVSYDDMNMNIGVHVGKIAGNKLDTTITNSTITTGAQTGFPMGAIRVIGTDNTLTINNSTIDVRAWTGSRYINLASDTTYVGDNNEFVHAATGGHIWERNSSNVASNLAAWQTYSGQDANSTEQPGS